MLNNLYLNYMSLTEQTALQLRIKVFIFLLSIMIFQINVGIWWFVPYKTIR